MSIKIQTSQEKKLSDIGMRMNTFLEFNRLTKYRLAKILNISGSYIADMNSGRIRKGGIKFWDAIRREFPDWEDYLRYNSEISINPLPKTSPSRSTELSFKRLAVLMGLQIEPGWLHRICEELDCQPIDITKAIVQDQIPDDLIQHIEKMGYAKETWLQQQEKVLEDDSDCLHRNAGLRLAQKILFSRSKYANLLAEYIMNLDKTMRLDQSVQSQERNTFRKSRYHR